MKKQGLEYRPDTGKLDAVLERFDEKYSFQAEMRKRFVSQANEVLGKYKPKKAPRQIGFEIEYSVVDEDIRPVSEEIRNRAIKAANGKREGEGEGLVTKEVGAAQIEIVSVPKSWEQARGMDILAELKETENRLAQELAKDKAYLFRIGANPLMPIGKIKNTKKEPKYVNCPRFHEDNQRKGIDRYLGEETAIDVTNALVPGITNAVQMNVDCLSPNEAVDIFNRAFFISPVATVFGANAGFLDSIDTGYADLRYLAWSISHDIRSWEEVALNRCLRVGMPDDYFTDVNDYLNHVLATPFFMKDDHAFAMAIGTFWRDARLKFLEKGSNNEDVKLIVEFRSVATQPTIEEDYAMMMFYLGRVMFSRDSKERMLPMSQVRANKDMAMRLGKEAELYFYAGNGKDVVTRKFKDYGEAELEKSLDGLNRIGLDNETCKFVEKHLKPRLTKPLPVDKFRQAVKSGGAIGIKNAIHDLGLLVGR